LLEARLRLQEQALADAQRERETALKNLQLAEKQADALREQIAAQGQPVPNVEYTAALVRATNIRLNSLLTSGISKDDAPGDDAIVVQFAPYDDDGEIVKLPGQVTITAIDPAAPETDRQVGYWEFTPEECREGWTRGFIGSGYQFTVTLDSPPQHEELLLHIRLTTADNRTFEANQIIRVVPGGAPPIASNPTGPTITPAGSNISPAGHMEAQKPQISPRPQTPHSANWTEATLPQYR